MILSADTFVFVFVFRLIITEALHCVRSRGHSSEQPSIVSVLVKLPVPWKRQTGTEKQPEKIIADGREFCERIRRARVTT